MDVRVTNRFEDAVAVEGKPRPNDVAPVRLPANAMQSWKRPLDLVLVIVTLPISIPILTLCILLSMLDGGPAFYRQPRIGRGGRAFQMLKLRTMRVNAERQLTEILMSDPHAAIEWQQTQKLRRDPRITIIGKILRKSSLDELPQIWNVLKGEMSLVGPRPMLREQVGMYPGLAYFRLRPGITGPWQVFGRNDASFASRAKYDAMYEREMSIRNDLSLIVRTVGVVFGGTGH